MDETGSDNIAKMCICLSIMLLLLTRWSQLSQLMMQRRHIKQK
ncbi:unnamed protein product [Arabidopsis halleri]